VIEIERERKVRERKRSVWFPTDTHREKVERERENLCDWGLNRKKETAGSGN
jgi:hypothetical protein